MKKLFFALAALMAIALPKAAQAVDVEGTYASAIGGLNFLSYDRDHYSVNFKAGWLAGAAIGYRFCEGFRVEGEAIYRYNRTKDVKFKHQDRVHIGGHLRTWSFMANGIYEVPVCWCVTPYVGAGIGYDTTKVQVCNVKGDKNGFAWQVLAGALYPIDDCLEMALEYRFHHGKEKDLYNNSVDLRLNWFF